MTDLAIAAAGADPGNGRAGVLTVTLRISSWLGFVACVPSAEVATLAEGEGARRRAASAQIAVVATTHHRAGLSRD